MYADYRPAGDLLKDRIVLVTGAGDGIGRAAALAYAAHGATVVLLGKTVPKLEAVYDEIESGGGAPPAIYPMHLEGATPHDYDELAKAMDTNFGRLDGILHNAASLPYLSRIKDYETEDWLKVMQVNLNAPFFLTQACLALLEKSDDASVLFTTTGNSTCPPDTELVHITLPNSFQGATITTGPSCADRMRRNLPTPPTCTSKDRTSIAAGSTRRC